MDHSSVGKTVVLLTEADTVDEGVKVARVNLLGFSAYYRGLTSSGMRDAGVPRLIVPDVSKPALQTVGSFIEANSKPTMIPSSLDKLEELIGAASYLQVDELLALCSKQLILHINKSWNLVLHIAQCYGLASVRQTVCKHITTNMHHFSRHEGEAWNWFQELPLDDLCSVLDDDDCTVTEKEVFDAALAWLQYKFGRVESFSSDVLAVVRFPLMSHNDLEACSNELVASGVHTNCYSALLQEARVYHEKRCSATALTSSRRTRIRNSVDVVIALGGFTASENSTNRFQILPVTELFDHSRTEIRFRSCRSERLPVRLCEHASCLVNDVLYVAGGQQRYKMDGRYTTRDVYAFHLRLCVWSSCSSMNVPRSLFYLGELNAQLYAVAGWTAVNEDTPTVERYTLASDSWQPLANYPLDVHEHAGCQHKGTLYVSGGFRGPVHGHIDQFCCYDAVNDVWCHRARLSKPRSYHSMASVRDQIIVAGGVHYRGDNTFDDLLLCEVYDETSDQWTLVTELSSPANCQPQVVTADPRLPDCVRLLLFGGHSFRCDADHHLLQCVCADSGGSWRLDRATPALLTHSVLCFTASLAPLPAHYVRLFE